jgi:hypothetical protein
VAGADRHRAVRRRLSVRDHPRRLQACAPSNSTPPQPWLRDWQTQRWIVLPQVLRAVAPSLANSAIALFKDTSLVTIVSLYELTGSLGLALSGDAQWRPFYLEAWIFIAAIYWAGLRFAGAHQLAQNRYGLDLDDVARRPAQLRRADSRPGRKIAVR